MSYNFKDMGWTENTPTTILFCLDGDEVVCLNAKPLSFKQCGPRWKDISKSRFPTKCLYRDLLNFRAVAEDPTKPWRHPTPRAFMKLLLNAWQRRVEVETRKAGNDD